MSSKIKLVCALLLGTVLAACANIPKGTQVGATSLNYNKVVADVKDELLLLNIARASEGRPMHFTRITNIKNSTTLQGGAELGGSYPDRGRSYSNTVGLGNVPAQSGFVENVSSAAKTLSPKISGSYSINPVVDYEVQDSKEFYNGILTHIDEDLFAHYLEQGWPAKFLAMLLIEKVVVRDGSKLKIFENNPEDENDLQINQFRELVNCARFSIEKVKPKTTSFQFEPARKSEGNVNNTDANPFSADELEKVSKVLLNDAWSIKSSNEMVHSSGGGHKVNMSLFDCRGGVLSLKYSDLVGPSLFEHQREKSYNVSTNQGTLRSIQGVMYYMGECLRNRNDPCFYGAEHDPVYVSRIQKKSWSTTVKNKDLKKGLAVRLDGETYFVPKTSSDYPISNDRTIQAISFINQMLALQQEFKEPPSTGTFISLN